MRHVSKFCLQNGIFRHLSSTYFQANPISKLQDLEGHAATCAIAILSEGDTKLIQHVAPKRPRPIFPWDLECTMALIFSGLKSARSLRHLALQNVERL